jgi:CubicO group peptidase (beta-lactamase class C family)
MKRQFLLFTLVLRFIGFSRDWLLAQNDTTLAQIRQILRDRIDKNNKSFGIVVGLIDKNGRRVVGYGKLSQEKNQEPDGNTVYEIGSITKVFTAILLQEMVERGEVSLGEFLIHLCL